MNIALITAAYSEENGGNEYYLAKELSKLGHNIFIIVSKYSPYRFGLKKTSSKSKLKNVTVIRLNHIGIMKLGMIYLFNLKKTIKKLNIDVVHVQEWFMPLSLSCMKHKNLVLTQRLANPKKASLFFKLYCNFIAKKINNKTKLTALTTDSKKLFSKLSHKSNNKISIIPNGVDTDLFKPIKVSKNQYYPSNVHKILAIGRLELEKGYHILIKTLSQIESNYHLIIVGQGSMKDELKNLIKKYNLKSKIKLINKIEHNKLPELYSSADFFVAPSLNEPFGFVSLEALSCNIPVIASDIGGMKDVITKDIGIKVKPNDIQSLKNAITQMLNNNKRIKLKKNTRNHIINNYSWKISTKKYLEKYNE